MLDDALRYVAAGLSVIPIDSRTKRPYWQLLPQVCDLDEDDDERRQRGHGTWKPFQDRIADEALIRWWFRRNGVNIGIVCGAVSGGLVVLDFDMDAEATYSAWCADYGAGAHDFPTVKTAKGYHVYARCADPGGNQTLAVNEASQVLIQTRGEHGYVLAPPSVHPSGVIYRILYGNFADIPTLL